MRILAALRTVLLAGHFTQARKGGEQAGNPVGARDWSRGLVRAVPAEPACGPTLGSTGRCAREVDGSRCEYQDIAPHVVLERCHRGKAAKSRAPGNFDCFWCLIEDEGNRLTEPLL